MKILKFLFITKRGLILNMLYKVKTKLTICRMYFCNKKNDRIIALSVCLSVCYEFNT